MTLHSSALCRYDPNRLHLEKSGNLFAQQFLTGSNGWLEKIIQKPNTWWEEGILDKNPKINPKVIDI